MTVHHNNVSKETGNLTNSKLIKTNILIRYESGPLANLWNLLKGGGAHLPYEFYIGSIETSGKYE